MAKNKLNDLNDHLMAQVERLNDESIEGDKMELEIKKAEAISRVSEQIISIAAITLKAMDLVGKGVLQIDELPDQFGVKKLQS